MTLQYLQSIRLLELECVLSELAREKPGRNLVLEIGAGSGWQARKLAENGQVVEAIDLDSNDYSSEGIWPITVYDGKRIPFPDNHFDVVFSSNVLEHIPHIVAFQDELRRVLKSDGVAVHVLPSASWRFWTNLAHYAFVLRTIRAIVIGKLKPSRSASGESELGKQPCTQSRTGRLRRLVFAARHGETGTVLTEGYYFSKYRWRTLFAATDWKIEKAYTNRLFYTGYAILGSRLSLELRRAFSYFFGSSCHIFVLRKAT